MSFRLWCHRIEPFATPKESKNLGMAHRSDRRSHWCQMVLAFGVVIMAVVLVRMDLRQQ
ncbi:hypothetical protein KR100_04185 [Synechococcus sp. KORDI-100]|uniref:hypothetical protein n=1 Tax=Synechococcus sp. KORDI-100 TaxID=1280380 RepID=UPI0004E07E1F|nr:hypothetical protein [Synechococcus sp. KORDI-100]AII42564.1 hypothetical protein KR100_04185 [Synechococcus sp. KORDI-100]